jgi:hypothetical protein
MRKFHAFIFIITVLIVSSSFANAASFYKFIDASQLALDEEIEKFWFKPDNSTMFMFSTNKKMYYLLNNSVSIK